MPLIVSPLIALVVSMVAYTVFNRLRVAVGVSKETCICVGETGTMVSTEPEQPSLPVGYALMQNYSNPFNPVTTIEFSLPEIQNVRMTVYDILGHEIMSLANRKYEAGTHRIIWNGKNHSGQMVSSGMYLYSIDTGKFMETRKMLLLR